jgi:hypothetical protein
MKFIKIDLLTLLIGLFLFASCKSSNTIGLDVDPATEIQGNLVDTITVQTRTVPEDVATTSLLLRYPLGMITDPELGTTEASLAMSVNIPSAAYSFGKVRSVDSAVLVLPYSTQFYGDSTSTYSFDVHQLSSDLSERNSFKSDQVYPYNTAVLAGNYTGILRPTSSARITEIVTGAPDTLRTITSQLRIKLDPAFISSTILSDTSVLKNNSFFTAAFKGLHVSLNKDKSRGTGGIAFFNFAGAGSNLEIYYKKENAKTSTAIDTVVTKFPVLTTSNPVAATVKHGYSTKVSAQLSDQSAQFETTYLQGLAGLRNKISFPTLAAFGKNVGGQIVINKAEIVIELSSGTDVSPFTPAPRLVLYRNDIAGQRVNIKDNQTQGTSYYGGFYDPTKKSYTFLVTGYLQDLIDSKETDYGTFLATSSSTEFDLMPPATSAARSIIGSFRNPTNKVKLNIYYTKVN